jgi:hypothetical protein
MGTFEVHILLYLIDSQAERLVIDFKPPAGRLRTWVFRWGASAVKHQAVTVNANIWHLWHDIHGNVVKEIGELQEH